MGPPLGPGWGQGLNMVMLLRKKRKKRKKRIMRKLVEPGDFRI